VARIVEIREAEQTRRTLALLTAFVLEHGDFPPLDQVEGVREDDATLAPAEPTPSVETAETSVRARSSPEPRGAPASRRGVRLDVDAGMPAGGGASLDFGVILARLAWLGATVDYGGYPAGEVLVHRVSGGAFAGFRPDFGRWHPGVRFGISGGTLHGASANDGASQPFVAGTLVAGLDIHVRGTNGFCVGLWGIAELASRASSFQAEVDAAGVGRMRGGGLLALGWTSRSLGGRR
jgi:hypothetical protein